mmetsp:Transcript_67622/g.153013  ORF Transcript_67622/g.153013 Transcript_67622/m.153013 type:complete len:423 (+) Transcript_67622:78-1346(+)
MARGLLRARGRGNYEDLLVTPHEWPYKILRGFVQDNEASMMKFFSFILLWHSSHMVGALSVTSFAAKLTGQNKAQTAIETFTLTSLNAIQDHSTHSRFCAALARDTAVIVTMAPGDQADIDSMMKDFAEPFFSLSDSDQQSFAPLHEPEPSDAHMGQPRESGHYTTVTHDVNSFLDTRLCRSTAEFAPASSPRATASSSGSLGVFPLGLDDVCPGCRAVIIAGQRALLSVGDAALRTALAATSFTSAQEGRTVRDLVDFPEDLVEGETSATVHRFACYLPEEGEEGGGGIDKECADGDGDDVAFSAHTDGTWLTLIPCTGVPGLEVLTATGWQDPEGSNQPKGGPMPAGADGGRCTTRGPRAAGVVVLVGDELQRLTDHRFPSAVHRVVRPQVGAKRRRVSAPLLLRASPKSGVAPLEPNWK